MSNFVTDPPDDSLLPSGQVQPESHPEHPEDPEETRLGETPPGLTGNFPQGIAMFYICYSLFSRLWTYIESWFVSLPQLPFSKVSNVVTDTPDDSRPPLSEEQNHPELSEEPEEILCLSNTEPYNSLLPSGEDQSNPEHSEDPEETRVSEMQRVIITSMCNKSPFSLARIYKFSPGFRATDLALGLKRIPAGFYMTVQVDGTEWQTTNKSVHIDQDIVEWNEHIFL